MNDLVVLRTDVNNRQRQTRGSGLIRTGLDARTGIYGSKGWGWPGSFSSVLIGQVSPRWR